jgi:hypothetical protein
MTDHRCSLCFQAISMANSVEQKISSRISASRVTRQQRLPQEMPMATIHTQGNDQHLNSNAAQDALSEAHHCAQGSSKESAIIERSMVGDNSLTDQQPHNSKVYRAMNVPCYPGPPRLRQGITYLFGEMSSTTYGKLLNWRGCLPVPHETRQSSFEPADRGWSRSPSLEFGRRFLIRLVFTRLLCGD